LIYIAANGNLRQQRKITVLKHKGYRVTQVRNQIWWWHLL